MKSLTKLWGDFHHILLEKTTPHLARRLYIEQLDDPNGVDEPLFVGVNTLSGAIDLFTQEEGKYLQRLRFKERIDEIPDKFLNKIKNRGYLFQSPEYEEIVFETIINRHKYLKYSKDKILSFFSIDMGCPVGCSYCFEKKNEKQTEEFERAIMDETAMTAAYNTLDVIRTLQQKEVDFVAGWGGEPLQEKNTAINELFMDLAIDRRIPIAYFSSLVMMGNKLYSSLAKRASKIKFLQTTLDAVQPQHDRLRQASNSFNRTVYNINRLLEADLPVIVRTNVGPHNISHVPELAQFYEERGWFNYPKFKAFVVKTYDRYHDLKENMTFSEDEALSCWLKLKDEYPAIRKMQTLKYAPSLLPILRAFELRESIDITQDNFEIQTKPMLTYCYTGNRAEYVFTGSPNYSIYTCAECTGISKFKLGSYYPKLTFDSEKKKMWGVENDFFELRSIDTLKECKTCIASTHCGGYCALEAITDHGTSRSIHCSQIQSVIPNFLKKESARLYKRGRLLMERSENLTL